MNDIAFLDNLIHYTNVNPTRYNSKAWNKIKSILNNFAVPVEYTDNIEYGYDGDTIFIEHSRRATHDLIHELCHWIVCEPKRRNKIEFGLGSGFSTKDRNLKPLVSKRKAQFEEDCACILSFIILRQFNLDVKSEAILTEYLDYSEVSEKTILKIFDSLYEWNIIDKERQYTGRYRC